ncbi:MAG: TetR family transcriptional regulator [Deltaproteobacteria bacterium]|jgi:TetR/AcrR family transcriptional regulator|nr:TetR family transcriptional regulator [Deltaproteobacteria bacterium]
MTKAEKTLQKKQTILNAAIDVLYEDKISGANLRKIATVAEMSQGNLHYYYPSKEVLYIDVLDFILQGFLNKEGSILYNKKANLKEKLFFVFEQGKDYILHKKRMIVVMDFIVNGMNNDKLHLKIREIYTRWRSDAQNAIAHGEGVNKFNATYGDIMPTLIIAVMDGAALQYLIYGEDFDLESFYTSIHTMISNLLA